MNLDNIIAQSEKKTIYRDGDVSIKLFAEGYSKADILNEATNQARVEGTGVNIPKVLGVTMIGNQWAIMSEYIEGKTLKQLMDENPEKEDEYLELFCKIQWDVLNHQCPMLNRLKEKMQQKISHTDLDASTRYDLHTRLSALPTHFRLCHGDFNPSNVIIKEDGTPYIIDWSHATQGNGAADAARTYLMFSLHKSQEFADKYLKMYSKVSDTAIQYIQRWMPIVAASQSVKAIPEEREFLLSWVNVFDYQ